MLIEQTPDFIRKLIPGAVWRLPQKEKTIYLTFDDGPIPEITPWVLDLLKKYDIKATFFCVGDNVHKYPEVFKMITDAGHAVGNHTFNHLQGFKVKSSKYVENVELADSYIHSKLFRPPHGHLRINQGRKLANRFKLIMWDVVTRDYNKKLSGEYVLNVVKRYARNGSLIVFHDSIKAEKNMKYALPKAIEFLISQGYKFKKITEEEILKAI